MSTSTVVIVTGVSSGIGRITAKQFADQGCRVFGTVRSLEHAKRLSGVELIELDVRDEASVEHGIRQVIDQAKRIDVLVNNAGVSLIGAIEETSIAEATALFDTNFFGILRTTKAVLPYMREQGSGKIINVSSVLGFLPSPYMGLYAASKHAVEGFSESLDHEVRQFGVRVVLVEPAFTKTTLDTNSSRTASTLTAYHAERNRAATVINTNIEHAPLPETVAKTILKAAFSPWQMRHQPKGKAALLSKLRRFMPSSLVDASLRKSFGLRK